MSVAVRGALIVLLWGCSETSIRGISPVGAAPPELRLLPDDGFELQGGCPGDRTVVTPVVFNDGALAGTVTGVVLPPGWTTPREIPFEVPGGGAMSIPMAGPMPATPFELEVATDQGPLSASLTPAPNPGPELRFLDAAANVFGGDTGFLRAQVSDNELPEPFVVYLRSDQDGAIGTAVSSDDGFVEWEWNGEARSPGLHRLVANTYDRCGQEAIANLDVCQTALASDALGLEDWTLFGDAFNNADDGWIVLAPSISVTAGSAFRLSEPVIANDIDISFRFWIGGGDGADGISLTVIDAAATEFVGGWGGGIGFSGLPGWSLEVDVWHNLEVDPTELDHVSLHLNGDLETIVAWSTLPEMEDNGWHDMHVRVDGAVMQVAIDGARVLDVLVPEITAFSGYLGFTAATGGSTHEHRVDSLLVETASCPGFE